MTLDAAQKFIVAAVQEPELVERINLAADSEGVKRILAENDFEFNYEEFEKAYFNVLTWCQNIDQANAVEQVKAWWDFLGSCLDNPAGE